jgi:MFS family permease
MVRVPRALPQRMQFLSVLRGRNYRNYYFGHLISVGGHQMIIATQSWLIYHLTGSPLALGLVSGAQAAPSIILNFYAGALADRANMRYIIVAAEAAAALFTGTLGLLVVTGVVEVWHIAVIAVFTGIALSFDEPARRALWPHLVKRNQYMYAVSLNSTIWSSTRILAPGIAGFIIAVGEKLTGEVMVGAGVSYFFAFAGFLVMALVVRALQIPSVKRSTGATVFHDILEGLLFVKRHSVLLILLVMTLVNGFFGLSYMWLMPVFAEDYLSVDVTGFAMLLSFSGMGGILGTIGVASYGQKVSRTLLVFGGGIMFGIFIVLFAISSFLVHSYPLALVLVFLIGVAFSVYQVASQTLLNLLVPDEFRGRLMGLRALTWTLAPMGSLLAGSVATLINTAFAVGLGGIAVVLYVLLSLALTPILRDIKGSMSDPLGAVEVLGRMD